MGLVAVNIVFLDRVGEALRWATSDIPKGADSSLLPNPCRQGGPRPALDFLEF